MENELIVGIILVVLYISHARGTRLAMVAQIEDLRLANDRNVREIDELRTEVERLQVEILLLE